jgi:uncharacterized membrane protein YdfJ with MMPL/SSD domain
MWLICVLTVASLTYSSAAISLFVRPCTIRRRTSHSRSVYLLFTIALSALTAVGITNLVYHDIMGQPLFEIVPIFAFVFLVSLGEDFNILSIARIREEVPPLGHRRG